MLFESFQPLFKHKPYQLVLLFGMTLVLGLSSGFSIVLLIPLLQLLTGDNAGSSNQIVVVLNDIAQRFAIELNLENILITYIFILSSMALVNFSNNLLSARYQQSLIFKIRQRLFRKIIMADWALLNNKSKTNHLQVLTQEIPKLSNYYFYFLRLLISLIMTASYVAWAFIISAEFTLVIIGVGLVMFFALRRFLFKAFHLGREHLKSYTQLLKYIDDFWTTVKIAKVHSSEDFYYHKFDQASSALLETEYKLQKNHFLPQLIYRLMGLLVLVGVVYVGYRYELIPLTSFFILIILFGRIYPQFTSFNTDINMITSNSASVELVMTLDNEFKEPDMNQYQKLKPFPLEQHIEIRNLKFSYSDEEELIKNLNATIPANSMAGIIGESGKGKTTLLDIIAGLQRPKSGEVLIDGNQLDPESWSRWRNGIGYLPQDSFFIDGTLRENIIWDCRRKVSDDEINKVLKQVNALHLINRYKKGLDEYMVNYTFHFSGGERQRLALARVLLRQPQILLLDEATSSLDQENEKQIMDLLVSLKHKVTIVLVTHKTTARPWLDKVITLDS